MELDSPAEPLQSDGVVPTASPSNGPASKEGSKDPERFYCPYPGCNRSFAELWRLKVHFRAPPDIRGSGKERGHGTELTHCPKCGKTLKPGKHHVGCSGSKANARQANKRLRPAGDADAPDEALAVPPQLKLAKAGDQEPLASAWQEFARTQGAHQLASIALQPPLKQEQQEWAPTVQHGILYGQNGAAAACWLPGHVNGFVPQLQPQPYPQQFPSELPFAGSTHGYAPAFHGLPSFSQPGVQLTESGQVLTLPPPAGGMQPVPQPAGVPALNGQVLFHQHAHEQPLLPPVRMDGHHSQQLGATPLHHPQPTLHPSVQEPQQASQVPNGIHSHGALQPQLEPRPGDSSVQGNGSVSGGHRGSGAGGGGGGEGGDGAAVPSAPSDAGGGAHAPPKPSTSNDADSLGSMFGDVEEFTRDFGRIPSPPPLPPDFHNASSGNGAGSLFNFAQFGQKLTRSSSQTRLDRNPYGLGLDPGLDGELLYDHSDDGDLMQLLFGVPDELPTMATIHLHKWNNDDEEDGEQQGAGAAPPSPPPLPPAGDRTALGGSSSGGGGGGQHGSAAERSGGHASASGTAAGAGADGLQQHARHQQASHGPGMNGKLEAHGGATSSIPDSFLGQGGSNLGGKASLAQLVNGTSNTHHGADEHHRDHLLDAETFRLLHSCD